MSLPSNPPPDALVARLRTARCIVVLTGAGISAESGIPTFREQGSGLWSRFDPQRLATPEAFRRDPQTVWAWYEWRRHLVASAAPNAGHHALQALAKRPGVTSLVIVTQNVDDLHERAGSTGVLHLHGSLFTPRCSACQRPFEHQDDLYSSATEEEVLRLEPPRCLSCGGRIRPGVVWFGEGLPESVWVDALQKIGQADLLLVVGTSGLVYPVASLPDAARRRGCDVAVINPDPETLDPSSPMDWEVAAASGLPALLAALDN